MNGVQAGFPDRRDAQEPAAEFGPERESGTDENYSLVTIHCLWCILEAALSGLMPGRPTLSLLDVNSL
jgi:hypothetical protein